MSQRAEILAAYHQLIAMAWRDQQLTLAEVNQFKVFAAVYKLTPDEHETVVTEIGVEHRELTDENNCNLADWLRFRQHDQSTVVAPQGRKTKLRDGPWQRSLSPIPRPWQNVLAVISALVGAFAAAAAFLVPSLGL